ncbi:hypothetical protein Q7P37_004848 [Cladosporium fusiforme]
MAPSTRDEGSPARAALEKSLTLNKKQSWFGSIKSAVHQSALSAKAAVEALRGGHDSSNNSITLTQDELNTTRASSDTTQTKRSTPSRLSSRDGLSPAKTAVASLRQQLSRRSRNSKRVSVSDVFRRTGSNASSLRGARGPESYYRNSVDLSGAQSPLAKEQDQDQDKDSASSIPLPSSPIAIPSPQIPSLKLDFGLPALLSSITGVTEAELAEREVLQDPKDITAGAPSSHPLAWDCGKADPRVPRHDSAITESMSSSCWPRKPSSTMDSIGFLQTPLIERDDPFRQASPMPGTTLCLEVEDATQGEPDHSLPAMGEVVQSMDVSNPCGANPALAKNGILQVKREEIKTADGKTCLLPSPLAMFQFEEPALGAPCSGDRQDGELDTNPSDAVLAHNAMETQQAVETSNTMSPTKELDLATISRGFQQGSDKLSTEPRSGRSDSMLTQVPDSPGSDENLDPQAALSDFDAVGAASLDKRQKCEEYGAPRKDSLFDDIEKTIPQHGPPSPTRTVRLPLRPKTPLTKHNSCESMIFRPILDRLAAKKLGSLRPGSDPTLRQRYFPHVAVDVSTIVEYPRQTSLDSDGSKTSEESKDDSGIFERAVEPVSPLHIRKQTGITPIKDAPSPHTPRETVDPHTPGSSPFRTPSMGDRRLFDMQRAERNARYNAIHSIHADFDFQLADFGHAGPGSRGSTPGRNSADGGSESNSPLGCRRRQEPPSNAPRAAIFHLKPNKQEYVMRPTLYRSRNALLLSARRFQHHVSARKQPSGLNAIIHHAEDKSVRASSGPLSGRSIAVKDNIATASQPSTAASKVLSGFTSPFDATVVKLLQNAGASISSKASLDEFGMGSHSQTSFDGPVLSSFSRQGEPLSPGGSSGGSAVAVATGEAWAALGTDTGGSVRLPAAYCGIVGFKPSYGLLSRWGVIQYANSLDTVGVLARNVADTGKVFNALNAHDKNDPTSLSGAVRQRLASQDKPKKGALRIGVPSEYNIEELTAPVRAAWEQTLSRLQQAGHTLVSVSLPATRQALSAYYVLAPAEASSNLAKYDGVRYGHRTSGSDAVPKENSPLYASTRGEGFGEEVRRRILLGAYALSSEAIDNYFIQAQKVRRLVQQDFDSVFAAHNPLLDAPEGKADEGVDFLITPTAPTLPPTLAELKRQTIVESYMLDVFTVPASLAGLPALSVPIPLPEDARRDLGEEDVQSVGIQVIGQYGSDESVLDAGRIIEELSIILTLNFSYLVQLCDTLKMSQQPRRRDRFLKFLPHRHRGSQASPASTASASSSTLPGANPSAASVSTASAYSNLSPAGPSTSPHPSKAAAQSASSQSAPVPTTGLSLSPTQPAIQVTAPPPLPLEKITLDRVLSKLTEEEQNTIRGNSNHAATDISDTLGRALIAAERKKQLCVSKRWTLSMGSRAISSKEKADKVIAFIDKFKKFGATVASADPIHAGIPWAGVCMILEVAVSEKQQLDALLSGVATSLSMKNVLDAYCDFYHNLPPSSAATTLEMALLELYAIVLRFLATAINLLGKSHFARFWKALTDDGEVAKFASICRDAEGRVEIAASSCDRGLDENARAATEECKNTVNQVLNEFAELRAQANRIELNTNFAKLPRANTAAFDSIDEERLPRCLENTRVQLQEDVERWINDPSSASFFWLQGVAGTGKSTIARTIAKTLHDHGLLGASFFFKRSHAERGNADLFFSSIATQLAGSIPGLGCEMAKVLEVEAGGYKKGVSTQFNELLLNPLRNIQRPPQVNQLGLFILIDALDECDVEGHRNEDASQILEMLSRLKEIQHLRLRMIVTSRLEFPVELGFARMSTEEHRDLVLHEIAYDHVEHDIQVFFKARLSSIRVELCIRRKRDVLRKDWPGDAVIQELTQRSMPLFIFASTVCKFIADSRFAPQDQMQKILDNHESLQLDSTYLLVLETLIPKSDLTSDRRAEILSDFRDIIGLIIFSTEPPSISTIAALLDLNHGRVEAILDSLHSVLDVTADLKRPIRPFHLSFIEFLARPKKEHDFLINESQAHAAIADKCLYFMMQPNRLKQDICQVRHPGTLRVNDRDDAFDPQMSESLAYACRYFAHHLSRSQEILDDQHAVYDFLSTRFIYWFEAMSWLGCAYDVLHIIRNLQSHTHINSATSMNRFLTDGGRFAREFQYIADLAPLQLYASALTFAPECSIVKSAFKHCIPKWLKRQPKVDKEWNTDVFALDGHTSSIVAMAFSPDDEYLATCSHDGTVRIWDTKAMACLHCYSYKPHYSPKAVAFSKDSTTMVVVYQVHRFWRDPHVFQIVTYGMADNRILSEVAPIDPHLKYNEDTELALATEENGTVVVALVCSDWIQVLRTSQSQPNVFMKAWIFPLPNNEKYLPIFGVTILLKARVLACYKSTGITGTHRLATFGLETGDIIHSRPGDFFTLHHIAYQNTKMIVVVTESSERDLEPVLGSFNISTGFLDRHIGVTGVASWSNFAISNSENTVAFSNHDDHGTVQIRSLLTSHTAKQSPSSKQDVRSLKLSANGTIAVRYSDHIEVLDLRGESIHHLETWASHVFDSGDMAISPDGSLIGEVRGRKLRIWDLNASTQRSLTIGSTSIVQNLAFSRSKRRVAILFLDTLAVWDLETSQTILSADDGLSVLFPKLYSSFPGTVFLEKAFSDDDEELQNCGILWLPKSYRAKFGASDSHENVVALGHDDGSVTIMELTDAGMKSSECLWPYCPVTFSECINETASSTGDQCSENESSVHSHGDSASAHSQES